MTLEELQAQLLEQQEELAKIKEENEKLAKEKIALQEHNQKLFLKATAKEEEEEKEEEKGPRLTIEGFVDKYYDKKTRMLKFKTRR